MFVSFSSRVLTVFAPVIFVRASKFVTYFLCERNNIPNGVERTTTPRKCDGLLRSLMENRCARRLIKC